MAGKNNSSGSDMDFRLAMLAALFVGACGGNPMGDAGTGGGSGGSKDPLAVEVPEEVANNLRAISYTSADGGKLQVNMEGLTASSKVATFVRAKSLDMKGYKAFTYQETGLQRQHLAFVADSLRGNLRAAVVADGGQFNRHYGGGTFARIDVYNAPVVRAGVETGQFSYTGTYAGLFLPGTATHKSLPAGLQPYSVLRTKGDALINANFANNLVNGGVSNRWLLDKNGNRIDMNEDGKINEDDQLAEISFPSTDIDDNGQFLGDVEFFGNPDTVIGSYAGLFGGRGATDVAGAIVLNPISGASGIWEYGVFNLPRCGTAGASPLCSPR